VCLLCKKEEKVATTTVNNGGVFTLAVLAKLKKSISNVLGFYRHI
jgi:hypothetical protein